MRITRRQLTQIIREELIREATPAMGTTIYDEDLSTAGTGGVSAVSTTVPGTTNLPEKTTEPQVKATSTPKRRRIPNDTVKELQIRLSVPDDGVWGPITQTAWDKFVQANYGHPDINPDVMSPSVKEVQSDWVTTGPKLGYEGDISGALTWVQQVQSTGESSTEIVPGQTLFGPKSPMTAATAEASGRIPSDLHINDSLTWKVSFKPSEADPWGEFVVWNADRVSQQAAEFYKWLDKGGQITIAGPDIKDEYGYLINDTVTLKNFLTPGPVPQQESIDRRWSRLAGLLVD